MTQKPVNKKCVSMQQITMNIICKSKAAIRKKYSGKSTNESNTIV